MSAPIFVITATLLIPVPGASKPDTQELARTHQRVESLALCKQTVAPKFAEDTARLHAQYVAQKRGVVVGDCKAIEATP